MIKNSAIVLLTRLPHEIWLDFLEGFNNYDIYIAIDDNSQNYSNLYHSKNKYMNINFIQFNEEECHKNYFYNLLIPTSNVPDKKVMSWDKAFYYFCKINNRYEHIWFIEDDVFFLSEDILINIDNAFPNSDLLTKDNFIAHTKENYCHSRFIKILEYPLYYSMVCSCRLSKRLLNLITDYANKFKMLEYHETLFNTLSIRNNLIIHNPKELDKIIYRIDHDIHNISNYMYHPMKNYHLHFYIRNNKKNKINVENYKELNDDLKHFSNEEAINHYYTNGIHENRKYIYEMPEKFNVKAYKELNDDLKDFSDGEAIKHYYLHGRRENRQYNYKIPEKFNVKAYKELNDDLKHFSDEETIKHYYIYGRHENREYNYEIPADFNVKVYKELNDDLKHFSDEDAIKHYYIYGRHENRKYNYKIPEKINKILCL
jgi:glutaredoxin-related protein